jgi:predicted esterase
MTSTADPRATELIAEPLRIPRIAARTLDGQGAAWAREGLLVDVLAQDRALPADPDEHHATLAIGWEERGLAVLVEVVGLDLEEQPEASRAYESTAVEIFVRAPAAPTLVSQAVISPGVDARQPEPRISYFDHRAAALRQGLPPILAHCARRRTAQGYVLAVVMALESIGLAPSLGTTVEVRVLVNHRRAGEARLRQTWSSRAADEYTAVRLGAPSEASAPIDAAAWGTAVGYDEFAACAILPSARAGEALRVRQDGAVLAEARAVPWRGRALAAVRVPIALVRPGAPIVLGIAPRDAAGAEAPAEARLGVAQVQDLAATLPYRVRVSTSHPAAIFRPTRTEVEEHGVRGEFIFRGPRFPRLEVGSARLRAAARLVSSATRWLDGAGRVVDAPASPGRYGAEVTMRFGDGTSALAHETLVRIGDDEPRLQPGSALARLFALAAAGTDRAWPPGIPDARDALPHSLARNREAARLLAAFLEDPTDGCRPDWIERRWWHRARAALGTAVRYQSFTVHPPGWERGGATRWPAVIFLHGSGGDYPPFEKRTPGGDLHAYAQRHPELGAVVYSLQASDWWDSCALADVVARIVAEDRIDPDRVIVSGFSMGGYGTWQAILDTPELYAAAIPIAGGPGQPWDAARCRGVPIWSINGDADPITTHAQAQLMVDAVRAAGGDVRYTVLPGHDHGQTVAAAPDVPGLWAWALAQRRRAAAPARA